MDEHNHIWNEIGTLHFNAGAYLHAGKAYQRAIKMGKGKIAMQNLALAYIKENKIDKAVAIYKNIVEESSDEEEKAGLWQWIGELYSQLEDHENASQAYRLAKKEMPIKKNEKKWPSHLHPTSTLNWDDEPPQSLESKLASAISVETRPKEGELIHINIEEISINPVQPRIHIDIHFLAESIREYGIIQPLIVSHRDEAGLYTLISGERRLKAAHQVGLDKVPAIIRNVDEAQRLKLALVENIQRKKLSPLEEATAYQQLKNNLKLSPDQIAKVIGRNAVMVKNLLHLLEMPKNIQRALETGRISEDHARSIFLLEDEHKRDKALEEVLANELSLRKTKALVRSLLRESIQVKKNSEDVDTLQKPSEQVEEVGTALVAANVAPTSTTPSEEFIKSSEVEVIEEVEHNYEKPESKDKEALDTSIKNNEKNQEEIKELIIPNEAKETNELIYAEPAMPQTANFDNQSYTDEEIQKRILTLTHITETDPNNDKAWHRLGKHYSHLAQEDFAIDAYSKATELAPNRSDYFYQLGQAYLAEGRFTEAAETLEKVIVLDENNTFARCALASSYRHLNMDDKANIHLDIVAPKMRLEESYNQACFEAIRGNITETIKLLEVSLERNEATIEKIQKDSDFDFVRHELAFIELIESKVLSNSAI